MMHRFPKGLAGDKVHQKRVPSGAPPWLETVRVHFPRYGRGGCVRGVEDRSDGRVRPHHRTRPVRGEHRRITAQGPYGGEGTGPNPTDRGKLAWKWSVASERHGVPIGWAIDGANRNDGASKDRGRAGDAARVQVILGQSDGTESDLFGEYRCSGDTLRLKRTPENDATRTPSCFAPLKRSNRRSDPGRRRDTVEPAVLHALADSA